MKCIFALVDHMVRDRAVPNPRAFSKNYVISGKKEWLHLL